MSDDLNSLESFLNEVEKHIPPAKETTIFDVGGRGYYENPATDLLKFFLKPDAGHGLGDLFLSTFLECIGEGHRQLDLRSVDIESQEKTDKGNLIDLRILERNWCLIIENKIYHGPSNPFLDYEAHAGQLRKDPNNLFSILSPNGILPPEGSATPGRWKPLTYKNYFQKLRDRMVTRFFEAPFSKWHIFTREFILHMENELYNPPMTDDQKDFIEQRADQFAQAEKLAKQYRLFICQKLKCCLEGLQLVPGNFLMQMRYRGLPSGWLFAALPKCWATTNYFYSNQKAQTKSFLFELI